jgi:hypothetical protein
VIFKLLNEIIINLIVNYIFLYNICRQGAIAAMALGLELSIWSLVKIRTGGSGFLGITQLTFGIFGVAVIISYHLSIMTTIVLARKNNKAVVAGDGQESMGNTVVTSTASKIRKIEKRDVVY